jgi:hypothetical protein
MVNWYSRFSGGFRWWLQLCLHTSPAASECSVGEVRAGWVEAEMFVEDDLELVIGEGGFHEFDAVDVGRGRRTMARASCSFFMDSEGCSAS